MEYSCSYGCVVVFYSYRNTFRHVAEAVKQGCRFHVNASCKPLGLCRNLISSSLVYKYNFEDAYMNELYCIVGTPFIKEEVEISKFFQKGGGLDFLHKKCGIGKIGFSFYKWGYHLSSY